MCPGHVVEHKPASLTFEQAAAVPLAGNTALMCTSPDAEVAVRASLSWAAIGSENALFSTTPTLLLRCAYK